MTAVLHAAGTLLIGLAAVGIAVWTAGALYWDVGRGSKWAWLLMLGWLGAVAWAFLIWSPIWRPFALLLVVWAVFLVWWFSQQASGARNWEPAFARVSRVAVDGGRLEFANVRNFEYRSLTDNDPHYETRCYDLSQLRGVDALIAFWGSRWMCHPFLVFDFGGEGRLAISIEVRYRVGQKYSFLRSIYRQQELIYVVSDERDAILRRTKFAGDQDVFLYPMVATQEEIRQVLDEYIASINRLAEKPAWYHGLFANCTVSIYRQRGRNVSWDWRFLFNGTLDKMLYDRGRLDTRILFDELKRQSRVTDIANRAPMDEFGDAIRRELPLYPSGDGS